MPADAKPKKPFKTVAVIGKYGARSIAEPLFALADFLAQRGLTVLFEAETAANIGVQHYQAMTPEQLGRKADVAVVVGGDGTMLGIARQLAPFDVPLIGINQGRLGFMTDIPMATQFDALAAIMDGAFVRESRTLLQARVERSAAVANKSAGSTSRSTSGNKSSRGPSSVKTGFKTLFEALAFNDVVVARGAVSAMIELTVEIDGQYTYTQRADGLIIATPTGSTAYALSAHGPILHPALAGVVLVPIAPQALSNRPIVVPDSAEIVVTVNRVSGNARTPASASFDMQTLTALHDGDRIVVRLSPHRISFLHPVGYNYFGVLRQKLNWTLMPVGSSVASTSVPSPSV